VIGGGLLGLEAARAMLNHGLEVHVIHQSPHLMNQQLDAQVDTSAGPLGTTVTVTHATFPAKAVHAA